MNTEKENTHSSTNVINLYKQQSNRQIINNALVTSYMLIWKFVKKILLKQPLM